MTHPKTILITSFHGLVSRVLASGLVDLLVKKNYRVILLVPPAKMEYFQQEFSSSQVVIEPILYIPGRFDSLLTSLSYLFLPSTTMRIKWRSDIRSLLGYGLNVMFAQFGFLQPFLRALLHRIETWKTSNVFNGVIQKYTPDLVFSTDLQGAPDIAVLKTAKRLGVKTVGMIRSWDNPTAKGLLRFVPDRVIACNQWVKTDIARFNGISLKKIEVVGVPHYDLYVNHARTSRANFFHSFGGDPSKRLLLFAPAGDRYTDRDKEVFAEIAKAMQTGVLPRDLQVLVRFPPGDTVTLGDFAPPPGMFFFQPGISFSGKSSKDREMSLGDVESLADQMYHSDVVLSGPSTIVIDAAAFGKPVILYAIDGYDTNRPLIHSMRRYLQYEHVVQVVATGGVRVVASFPELWKNIHLSLREPELDRAGRERMIKEQIFQLDGHGSERLLGVLIQNL